MTIFSTSERGTWKRCRRMWHYSSMNARGLEPVRPREYFTLGRVIHKCLAQWTADPRLDLDWLYMTAMAQEVEAIRVSYRATVGCDISDAELGSTYEAAELGRAMMKAYRDYHGQPLPKGFKLISNEQECHVPVGNGEHFIEGKFDGLVSDDAGTLYVLERKTYSRRPRPIDLEMNAQFKTYVWIANSLDVGYVGGVLYDGMLKRVPGPKTKLADLFHRDTITFNSAQMAVFERELEYDLTQMAGEGQITTTVPWNGCSDCQFQEPCLAWDRGEDAEYMLTTNYKPRARGNGGEEGDNDGDAG